MKIFTTGDIGVHKFKEEAQKVLDDVGRYLRENQLSAEVVQYKHECYDRYRTIFSAIVAH